MFPVISWSVHRNSLIASIQVVDFLSFRQNDFLGKFKMEERPSAPLAALSEVSLMSDISTEFSTVVGMYALNEGEAAANGNCPFLLDRILHKVRVRVPLLLGSLV